MNHLIFKYVLNDVVTANLLEARTIKYINFPTKYLNFIEIYM